MQEDNSGRCSQSVWAKSFDDLDERINRLLDCYVLPFMRRKLVTTLSRRRQLMEDDEKEEGVLEVEGDISSAEEVLVSLGYEESQHVVGAVGESDKLDDTISANPNQTVQPETVTNSRKKWRFSLISAGILAVAGAAYWLFANGPSNNEYSDPSRFLSAESGLELSVSDTGRPLSSQSLYQQPTMQQTVHLNKPTASSHSKQAYGKPITYDNKTVIIHTSIPSLGISHYVSAILGEGLEPLVSMDESSQGNLIHRKYGKPRTISKDQQRVMLSMTRQVILSNLNHIHHIPRLLNGEPDLSIEQLRNGKNFVVYRGTKLELPYELQKSQDTPKEEKSTPQIQSPSMLLQDSGTLGYCPWFPQTLDAVLWSSGSIGILPSRNKKESLEERTLSLISSYKQRNNKEIQQYTIEERIDMATRAYAYLGSEHENYLSVHEIEQLFGVSAKLLRAQSKELYGWTRKTEQQDYIKNRAEHTQSLYNQGISVNEIALHTGTSRSTVYRDLKRRPLV